MNFFQKLRLDYFKRYEIVSAVTAFKKSSLTSDIYTVIIELECLYIWK